MRGKLALLIVVGAISWGTFKLFQSDEPNAPVTVQNQLWISELPENERHKFDILLMVEEERAGVFVRTSQYEGDFSTFLWKQTGSGTYNLLMLQHNKTFKMKTKQLKDCGVFDHCMEVKGAPRGAKRYFTMDDWVIEKSSNPTIAAQNMIKRLALHEK